MCPAGEEGIGVTMEENVIELKNVEKTFRDFWLRPLAHAVRGLDLEVRRGDAVFAAPFLLVPSPPLGVCARTIA